MPCCSRHRNSKPFSAQKNICSATYPHMLCLGVSHQAPSLLPLPYSCPNKHPTSEYHMHSVCLYGAHEPTHSSQTTVPPSQTHNFFLPLKHSSSYKQSTIVQSSAACCSKVHPHYWLLQTSPGGSQPKKRGTKCLLWCWAASHWAAYPSGAAHQVKIGGCAVFVQVSFGPLFC